MKGYVKGGIKGKGRLRVGIGKGLTVGNGDGLTMGKGEGLRMGREKVKGKWEV